MVSDKRKVEILTCMITKQLIDDVFEEGLKPQLGYTPPPITQEMCDQFSREFCPVTIEEIEHLIKPIFLEVMKIMERNSDLLPDSRARTATPFEEIEPGVRARHITEFFFEKQPPAQEKIE